MIHNPDWYETHEGRKGEDFHWCPECRTDVPVEGEGHGWGVLVCGFDWGFFDDDDDDTDDDTTPTPEP
jgi:hypothetical protein